MANTIILPFSELQADLNDEAMIDPNAIIEITENGRYNVARYGYADVNVEGGGGETWNTVFEGSVTTQVVGGAPFANGNITGVESLTADTIKVTFNGVEYTCEKRSENDSYGAPYDDGYDWSEYPFCITSGLSGYILVTETAGTYTLKIEEPQSGGSSDFSTAEVTLVNNFGDTMEIAVALADSENLSTDTFAPVSTNTTATIIAILYKGTAFATINTTGTDFNFNVEAEGDAEVDGSDVTITGDCTITISAGE